MTTPAPQTRYLTQQVDDLNIFYREAGDVNAPVLLLLHGFPTSSLMFRHIIEPLAANYRVIAPDLPGFGFSDAPSHTAFTYSFDNLAKVMKGFVQALELSRFAIVVFDYGAPVGLRLALDAPEKISAIITQNGNAYQEGVGDAFAPIQKYWNDPTQENRDALRGLLSLETTQWQYVEGVSNPALIAPETYTLDAALMARSGNDEIQLDLFLNYESNLALYPAFQEYFRTHQPPLLAVWGKNDPFFVPPGAKAFKRDLPNAEIHFFDTGHFALETHAGEILALMHPFLHTHLNAETA